jgi:hypothetical protein
MEQGLPQIDNRDRRPSIKEAIVQIAQNVPLKLKLSTIFKEMITLSIAEITISALALFLIASPSYNTLKFVEFPNEFHMNHNQTAKVLLPGQRTNRSWAGLHYESDWRVKHWVINFLSVSSFMVTFTFK